MTSKQLSDHRNDGKIKLVGTRKLYLEINPEKGKVLVERVFTSNHEKVDIEELKGCRDVPVYEVDLNNDLNLETEGFQNLETEGCQNLQELKTEETNQYTVFEHKIGNLTSAAENFKPSKFAELDQNTSFEKTNLEEKGDRLQTKSSDYIHYSKTSDTYESQDFEKVNFDSLFYRIMMKNKT